MLRTSKCTVVLLMVAACTGEPRNNVDVAASEELGVLEFAPAIRGRDGGYGARFGGRSVWVFGDTPLDVEAEDGSTWRTSTFTTTVDDDASDGLAPFVEPLDGAGAPGQLLPFTEDEAAWNLANTEPNCRADACDHKWVLWPGQLLVDPTTDEGLLFYWKIRDWESHGTGLATWSSPDEPVMRGIRRAETSEPTLLFQADEPQLGTAAMLWDGQVYAWGCVHQGWWAFDCPLGRVAVEHALDRDAWEFWTEAGWDPDHSHAVSVLDGASILTIHHNEYLGQFVAVYSSEDEDIVFRVAPAPEGPWSEQKRMHVPLAPSDDSLIYDAMVHPELSTDGGRTIYMTYSRITGFLSSELRLVRVDFAG